MRVTTGILYFLLEVSILNAQSVDSLILGTDRVHTIELDSYTVVWSQLVIEPDGNQRQGINTITDSVLVDRSRSNGEIRRVLKWEDVDNNVYIKSDLLDYQTLRPKAIDIRWNPGYVQHTDILENTIISTSLKTEFDCSKVHISRLSKIGFTWSSDGFALIVANKVPAGRFYLQTLAGLPHNPKLGLREFEFQSTEEIDLASWGIFKSKKIEDLAAGNIKTTYWVTDRKPYIVQVRFQQPNGQVTIWKIESIK